MNRFTTLLTGAATLALTAGMASACEAPIKVGVLHSLSGTMAISETTLKDTMLMLIDRAERQGRRPGLRAGGGRCRPGLGLAAVCREGARAADRARGRRDLRQLDERVSRKSVLPVIEELNGLLFYPVQYEGEESSKNVFYTGAAPNQQAIPATDYFLDELGRGEVRTARH